MSLCMILLLLSAPSFGLVVCFLHFCSCCLLHDLSLPLSFLFALHADLSPSLEYLETLGIIVVVLLISVASPNTPASTHHHLILLLTISSNKQTQSCIPNTYPIPLLAPAHNENICPHWTERWEIRTRPFGCHVSTITSLTAIVSMLSTFTLVILVLLAVWSVKRLMRLTESSPDWVGRPSEMIWYRLNEGVCKFGGLFSWRTKRNGDNENYVRGDELPVVAEDIGERRPLLPA